MADRLRIKLVQPSKYHADGRIFKAKRALCPSLTLPYIAALCPSDAVVTIENEAYADIRFDEPADIVGLTLLTTLGMRGYEVADEFRRRGVHVVAGGIHASMVPDEAAGHADTVVVGQADETWPEFIRDFRSGRAKARYVAGEMPPLEGLPVPRYDLLDSSILNPGWRTGPLRAAMLAPPWHFVQTARGCAHACEYCSVTAFTGRKYRTRPIADVVEEIRRIGARTVFFADDDIFASSTRSRELFEALIPLKIRWLGQACVTAGRDQEALRLAKRSGCVLLLLGIESLSRRDLDSVGKKHNIVEDYEANLARFRAAGILLHVNMMFGFGPEEPGVFRLAADFMIRNKVTITKWWPVMPLPGTALHLRMKQEGRLKDAQWWLRKPTPLGALDLKLNGIEMGEEVFRRNYREALARFYSGGNIARRIFMPPGPNWPLQLLLNLVFKYQMSQETSILEA